MALNFNQADTKFVLKGALTHAIGVIDATYLRKTEKPGFKLTKLSTPEEGFASSYKMVAVDPNGAESEINGSAVINLAKDMMLQDVDIRICDTANKPETGYKVGDKYFDFMVYTAASAAEGAEGVKHLYVKVSEFFTAYTKGNNAINISDGNKISLEVDTANANGLEVGANGLRLNLATGGTGGTTGTAGAMSSADKSKLDKAVTNEDFTAVTNEDVDKIFTDLGVTVSA